MESLLPQVLLFDLPKLEYHASFRLGLIRSEGRKYPSPATKNPAYCCNVIERCVKRDAGHAQLKGDGGKRLKLVDLAFDVVFADIVNVDSTDLYFVTHQRRLS